MPKRITILVTGRADFSALRSLLIIDICWSYRHTGRSVGSGPDPNHGISESISLSHFRLQDTASFPVHCHLEIHFSSLWLYGIGGSAPLWYLWYTWSCGYHQKTEKRNLHRPSYSPNCWLHRDISCPTFLWCFQVQLMLPLRSEHYKPLWNRWKT